MFSRRRLLAREAVAGVAAAVDDVEGRARHDELVLRLASGVHRGGSSKGGFRNTSMIIRHRLLNPPLLHPPL